MVKSMEGTAAQQTTFRWGRWAMAVVGLVAAYAALGYWAVPWVIRNQVPKFGQTELARQASIGKVSFNPFTLRLVADDLRLAEADGSPLVGVGRFAAQLQWRSLVQRTWRFGEILISGPSVNLAIAPDGKFNLAQLLDTLQKRPPDASASAEMGLPRLVIEKFALERGKVEMHDRRAGYENSFSPLSFELANFSTLPEHNDTHTLSVQSARGGKVRWKGHASVAPIRGNGELTLEDVSLPELAVYLKPYSRATLAAGRLSAKLPYTFSYVDGRFEAALSGAALVLRDLGAARQGSSDSFAAVPRLDLNDINADLMRRELSVGEIRAEGGKLRIRRDASGELDLAQLMVDAAGSPPPEAAAARVVVADPWKVAVKQVLLDQLAISAVDETVNPPLRLDADAARLQLQLTATGSGSDVQLALADAALSLANLTLSSGTRTPLKVARLGFADGSVDLAARRAVLGRLFAQDGQLQVARDGAGKIDLMALLPRFGGPGRQAGTAAPAGDKPWVASAKSVELGNFGVDLADQESGVKLHVSDLAAKLQDAGSDLKQPVRFDVGLALREGGRLSARGRLVPDTGSVQADVRVKQLALAPLQPLLARHVKLKIAGGNASAQGRFTSDSKGGGLRYIGAFNVAGLVLNEEDGDLFAAWKDVRADKLTASLKPARLDIPELRLVEPNAKLIIESDRSLNAARLLVPQPVAAAKVAPVSVPVTQRADDPFPVRIRRVRLQNAKLDFTDLSLQPQFSAKMYELNGVVNGLSSSRSARSQVELDGRVDEFGSARIRGELNPFAPSDNTDLHVVFKNVDMVSTSPYAMKFAGYKIAAGKLSLDLQYQVRAGQLQGANQIVIDKLTLGERVDSPDALKLPLELAIAILKDSDGRIDLGLPVTGNLNDPQFSYGAIIWKAIGNLLTRIVTAPFRALGAMLGVGGEKLEAIDFDPGSDRLAPPEREKIGQLAGLLAKREKLKLSVPGQYGEQADGAALRARAVRVEIARRAGIKLEAGEEPGPLDLGNRALRTALRELYAERFGDAALDQQKKSAERGSAAAKGAASSPGGPVETAQARLPLWQRVGKMIQGEPQVADATAFYNQLREALEQRQPLAADALTGLGARRAKAVAAALADAGVNPARAVAAAPEPVPSEAGKPVHLKLQLGAN